jgi:hypothetical protein
MPACQPLLWTSRPDPAACTASQQVCVSVCHAPSFQYPVRALGAKYQVKVGTQVVLTLLPAPWMRA